MDSSQQDMLKLLGQDEILSHLQESISNATKSILIVGPWIDAYFARKIIDSIVTPDLPVSFIVRVEEDDSIDTKTLSALNLAHKNLKKCHARCLKKLHSKVILIDKQVFYLGSANWYWYSLHESLEMVITGDISTIPDLLNDLEIYWESGTDLITDDFKDCEDTEPVKTHKHYPTDNNSKKIK